MDAMTKAISGLTADAIPFVRMNWLAVNGVVPKISENSTLCNTKTKKINV